MKLIDAYARIKELNQTMVRTSDVAACLDVTISNASHILKRLATSTQIINVGRNCWAFPGTDAFQLPEFLVYPFPTYISLQTALYYHGMISQIPSKIYAVSLARTKVYKNNLAEISIHHVCPQFLFGFEVHGENKIKLATPEKALLDFLYLGSAKSRLFHLLPELEFPVNFDVNKAERMIESIPSKRKQLAIKNRLRGLIEK